MSATTVATALPVARHAAISRKLVLSLFGLVPLGVYVFLHLWTNLTALRGPEAFDAALQASRSHPAFLFLEIFGLGVPLLVHTYFGIREIFTGRWNNLQYPTFDNLKFLLQRVSALGLAAFIVAHLWRARIRPSYVACANPPNCSETWLGMHYALSEGATMTVYVLGLLGICYHLANGVYTASLRTGLVVSPPAQRRMQVISALVFVALLAMSGAVLYGFQPFQAPLPPTE